MCAGSVRKVAVPSGWLGYPGALYIDAYYGLLLECVVRAWGVVGVHAVECDEELYAR